MPVSRPMLIVGQGVSELRGKAADAQFRAFCLVSDPRGILVFHEYVKKTQETPGTKIETVIRRLREMLDE
jgi:phage-related protein